MSEPEKVQYDKELVTEILRHINTMVVSLDRIGSEYAGTKDRKSEEELNQWLADFVFEWELLRKLSRIRTLLSDAFSYETDETGLDELEKAVDGLQYWSLNARNPSKETEQQWQEFRNRTGRG